MFAKIDFIKLHYTMLFLIEEINFLLQKIKLISQLKKVYYTIFEI